MNFGELPVEPPSPLLGVPKQELLLCSLCVFKLRLDSRLLVWLLRELWFDSFLDVTVGKHRWFPFNVACKDSFFRDEWSEVSGRINRGKFLLYCGEMVLVLDSDYEISFFEIWDFLDFRLWWL